MEEVLRKKMQEKGKDIRPTTDMRQTAQHIEQMSLGANTLKISHTGEP